MKQCTGSSGANGFVLIVQGGFEIRNDVPVSNMAKRPQGHDFWTGKRIHRKTRQEHHGPLPVTLGRFPKGKGGRGASGGVVMLGKCREGGSDDIEGLAQLQ